MCNWYQILPTLIIIQIGFIEMFLPQEKVEEQWRTYLPFLYKFYLEHVGENFIDVVGAKWCKQQKSSSQRQNVLSFIVAGRAYVDHYNQKHSYTLQQNLIRSYDLMLPQNISSQEINQQKKVQPQIIEKKKVFYERQITCLEDFILTKKSTSQAIISAHVYAVAIKNDSIRLLSAAKLAGRQTNKQNIFFSERSPFLMKNIRHTNLCIGNDAEVATVPLQKQVSVIRFQQTEKTLLCGCQDGTIVMINLQVQLTQENNIPSQCYTYFSDHKSSIRDLTFLTNPDDQKLLFASVAADGKFYIWSKQSRTHPAVVIQQGSLQPSSLIEVYPNQLVQGGRDCALKFFDIKKGYCYNYNQNNQIITKLYNLTSLIEYQKNKRQTYFDDSLRFISCQQSGKIVFWQGQKQFQHLTHKSRIASVDYISSDEGIFLVIEKQTAKMSFFSPVLFTHCLQDVNN